jgi:hypothetical protein
MYNQQIKIIIITLKVNPVNQRYYIVSFINQVLVYMCDTRAYIFYYLKRER